MKRLPAWPRMLKRATAAAYCDLTSVEFEREVAAGRLPMPIKLGSSEHWDRRGLDEHLDQIAGRSDDWRKEQPGLAA